MPIDRKGKDLLRAAKYDRFKKDISRAVAEYIRDRGSAGEDLQRIVEQVLREERFRPFFDDLTERTRRATMLPEKESRSCASLLVSEETGRDLQRTVPALVVEQDGRPEEKRYVQRLRSSGLFCGPYVERSVVCRRVGRLSAVWELLSQHPSLLLVIGFGAGMIVVAALLLGSVYEALLAALTLQASDVSTAGGKIGNIFAALGGVLLFFTSISLIVSHLLEQDRKRRTVHRLAEEYLQRTSRKR
jgi:hypothetical protein